uniref:PUM-HD domain-containing protein n=1 Tax=Parastrongyloides trichosuri TaxID=131310 RepID=A0A0N4ZV40_PARTI
MDQSKEILSELHDYKVWEKTFLQNNCNVESYQQDHGKNFMTEDKSRFELTSNRNCQNYFNIPTSDENNFFDQCFIPPIQIKSFNQMDLNNIGMTNVIGNDFGLTNDSLFSYINFGTSLIPQSYDMEEVLLKYQNMELLNNFILNMNFFENGVTPNDIGKNSFISDSKKIRLPSKLLRCVNVQNDKDITLFHIKSHIKLFAMDQYGSRFIQSKYLISGDDERVALFEAILPHIYILAKNVFGNYVIQLLFNFSNKLEREQLLDIISNDIFKLTINQFGCRVIQKILDTGDSEDALFIYNGIKHNLIICSNNIHGNHVVQKIVKKIAFEYHTDILNSIDYDSNSNNFVELSLHRHGCRIIQAMLEYFERDNCQYLIKRLLENIDDLLTHEYGNYVAQKVFIHSSLKDQHCILENLHKDMLKYSKNKFASNVIEVCLDSGLPSQNKFLIQKLFQEPYDKLVYPMIEDQYGNYVIQKMVSMACRCTRKKLIKILKSSDHYVLKHIVYKTNISKCNDFC